MKRTSFIYVFLLALIFGFILMLIVFSFHDLVSGMSLKETFSDIYHFISPAVLSVFIAAVFLFHWKRVILVRLQKIRFEEQENRYISLFNNMQDAVCITDNEKRITEINDAGVDILGYSREELTEMSLDQLIIHDYVANPERGFKQIYEPGVYSMYEGKIKTKSGEIKWIQVSSTEFYCNGEKIGAQDVIRDITLRKETEIKLQQTVEELHNLLSTRDTLLSIIAHDVRSPVATIHKLAEFVLNEMNGSDPEEIEKVLVSINNTSKNTYELLENLLSWSSSQTGKLIFHLEYIDLEDIGTEIMELYSYSAKSKGVKLEKAFSEDIKIYADRNMLQTILRNLVSNAIKYTSEGGSVSMLARQNGSSVEISVKDQGVGMSASIIHNIFNLKKNQLVRGTENESGSGLGLILCKELVEKLGGNIVIESEAGKGSIFTISFPVRDISK